MDASEPAPVFLADYLPGFADFDPAGPIRASALFRELQEAAGTHAAALGAGWRVLDDAKRVWLLSRFALERLGDPGWRSPSRVRTWPRGAERLFFLRDYEISCPEGVFARARGWWVLWDRAAGRPVPPERSGLSLPANGAEPVGVAAFPSVEAPRAAIPSETTTVVARRSDLDRNGHVNNARYVEWIFDAISAARDGALPPWRSIATKYSGQAREGDLVDLATRELPDDDAPGGSAAVFVTGVRPGTGEEVFAARVTFADS